MLYVASVPLEYCICQSNLVCLACMLIVSVLQYVKIGDLTQFGTPPPPDADSSADADLELPEGPFTPMGPEEEDSLTRQSTGAFSG